MKRVSHDIFIQEALKREGVAAELNNLKNEFTLYEELIKARINAGKTQEDIAKAMHTSVSAVGRLETATSKSNPTISTLKRYAEALGLELELKFVKPHKNKLAI